MTKLIHADLTYRLRGFGFRIHNALKGGHKEEVYEDAYVWLLEKEHVAYVRQPRYQIDYKGKQIGEYYPDLTFADGKVIADLKAASQIEPLHKAQVLSYVAVANAELGLILNFGSSSFQSERLPNFLQNRKPLIANQSLPEGLLYTDLVNRILLALHTVHHTVGPGFIHQVYRRATRIELELQGIRILYLKELPIRFEMLTIASTETRLILVDDKVLLSAIAVPSINHRFTERMRWAMTETKTQLGLIANFYTSRLELHFIRV